MAAKVETVTGVLKPRYVFTRPADTNAYSIGDLVANNTSAASVVPMSWTVAPAKNNSTGSFYIPAIRLHLDNATVTNAQFRVHLYAAAPTFTSAGDNGVFGTVVATGNANWMASYDATLLALHADGASGVAVPTEGVITPQLVTSQTPGSDVTIYGLVEALAAYTPKSAGTFTATLLVEQN